MVSHVGGQFHLYPYYDSNDHKISFDAVVHSLEHAESKSVFIFQAVCHNPTGSDYNKAQWIKILDLVKRKKLFALFDIAYQGFGSGNIHEDAWVIREAYNEDLEFAVCQSYSKNMGLYSERVGCVHIHTLDEKRVNVITSQLVSIIRSEISFSPAFGARVSTIVQSDDNLKEIWRQDVLAATNRLRDIREQILKRFEEMKTPGKWKHIVQQKGLFWYSGMSALQVRKLIEEYHIYGPLTGRVNIAGLNKGNIEYYCNAVDDIVRRYPA